MSLLVALVVLAAGIASGSTVVGALTGVAVNHHETVAVVAVADDVPAGHVGSDTGLFNDFV